MSETIIAATITVCGSLVVAMLNNWDKLFPRDDRPSPARGHFTPKQKEQTQQARQTKRTTVQYAATLVVLTAGSVVTAAFYLSSSNSHPSTTPASSTSVATSTGGSVGPMPLRTVLLREDFNDNANHWLLASDQHRRFDLKDGHYYMGSSTVNGYLSTIPIRSISNSDFQIESKIRKMSGDNGYFYGLVWGMKDEANFYDFGVTGDGRVAVTQKMDGQFHDYADTALVRDPVHKGNAENALRLAKEGNRVRFFVNDYLVHEMDFQSFFGDRVGFVMYNKLELAVDYLIVSTQ